MRRRTKILSAVAAVTLVSALATAGYADTSGLDDVRLSHTFKGSADRYNYAPTVVQGGTTRHYYWCGYANAYGSFDSDTILTQSYDTKTRKRSAVAQVLRPTAGAWDKRYTCNPSVVMGTFHLGTATYHIALYYVGASNGHGVHNSIGVAYSNDWKTFHKRSTPLLSPPSTCKRANGNAAYGYGQPTAYSRDGRTRVWLFYDDTCASRYKRVEIADETRVAGSTATITTKGFPHGQPGLEFGYDTKARMWYAVGGYDSSRRKVSWVNTRGNKEKYEHGGTTFQLYRIPAAGLTTGSAPWTEVSRVDTNLVGYESTTIPTIVRNTYGTINVAGVYPNVVLPFGVTNSARPPASSTLAKDAATTDTPYWRISEITWRPGHPTRPFKRYYSPSLHRNEVTTGYVDTRAFRYERTLGSLYEEPSGAATRALYGCRRDPDDYFVSIHADCEGRKYLGVEGYAYPSAGAGHTIPLYRCNTGTFHLVSTDPACEGRTRESLLGYASGTAAAAKATPASGSRRTRP